MEDMKCFKQITHEHLPFDFLSNVRNTKRKSEQPLVTTGLTLTGLVPELVEKRVELQAAQQRQAGTALAAGLTQRQSVPEQRQCTSQVPSRELHTHHAQQSVRLNAVSEQSVKTVS